MTWTLVVNVAGTLDVAEATADKARAVGLARERRRHDTRGALVMGGNELGAALNWTCGFSPDGPLECLDVATWHGFRLTDDGLNIDCMMASCETHRATMKADYEHPMESACGISGSRFVWPENVCYLEWGDESALSAIEEVPADAH